MRSAATHRPRNGKGRGKTRRGLQGTFEEIFRLSQKPHKYWVFEGWEKSAPLFFLNNTFLIVLSWYLFFFCKEKEAKNLWKWYFSKWYHFVYVKKRIWILACGKWFSSSEGRIFFFPSFFATIFIASNNIPTASDNSRIIWSDSPISIWQAYKNDL